MHPISYFQGAMLGLLQGVSELFPISSLGHSVILPRLVGWHIHQNDAFFITFLVATHLATAIVLFIFFFRGWLLVLGPIPAGLLGLLLEHALRNLFASAQSAAFFLILNGGVLYGAEVL